jgi:hypothetical protein
MEDQAANINTVAKSSSITQVGEASDAELFYARHASS